MFFKHHNINVINLIFIQSSLKNRCIRLIILPPSCAVVMKSGNLNFLEPSGPLRAYNGLLYILPSLKKTTDQLLVILAEILVNFLTGD